MSGHDRSDRRRVRGESESVVDARKKLTRSPSGQAESALRPEPHVIRAAIELGICPWCKRGPFKMLAGHVNQRHGVDRFEFREMAGLMRHESICDPDFSAERSAWTSSLGLQPPGTQPGRTLTWSTAGKARQRENARRVAKGLSREQREAMGRKGGATRGAQLRKERQPCVICDGPIAFTPGYPDRKTCSSDCLTRFKARSMSRMRGAPTHCKYNHEFTPENTVVRSNGSRVCRLCRQTRSRNFYLASKATA